MELKNFIKTVLVDICEAVDEAKKAVDNCAIAPATIVLSLGASAGAELSKETQHINKISFEVPIYYSARFTDKENSVNSL